MSSQFSAASGGDAGVKSSQARADKVANPLGIETTHQSSSCGGSIRQDRLIQICVCDGHDVECAPVSFSKSGARRCNGSAIWGPVRSKVDSYPGKGQRAADAVSRQGRWLQLGLR